MSGWCRSRGRPARPLASRCGPTGARTPNPNSLSAVPCTPSACGTGSAPVLFPMSEAPPTWCSARPGWPSRSAAASGTGARSTTARPPPMAVTGPRRSAATSAVTRRTPGACATPAGCWKSSGSTRTRSGPAGGSPISFADAGERDGRAGLSWPSRFRPPGRPLRPSLVGRARRPRGDPNSPSVVSPLW